MTTAELIIAWFRGYGSHKTDERTRLPVGEIRLTRELLARFLRMKPEERPTVSELLAKRITASMIRRAAEAVGGAPVTRANSHSGIAEYGAWCDELASSPLIAPRRPSKTTRG